jgi:iron(III) transport system substrate-binding protein
MNAPALGQGAVAKGLKQAGISLRQARSPVPPNRTRSKLMQGLSLEYKSPTLPQLQGWAQQQAQQSGYKTVGIYSGPLGFGYNTELLAKKKMPMPKTWNDLLKPALKGEIQVANPASSGTAYTMVATLVQMMGEDKAFEYLKKLHKNISQYTRSGTGPIKAAARGETTVSISFVHDAPR